ncbi:MAG: superfamily II DNA helicase RecQ [Planctomycetota bacterium]
MFLNVGSRTAVRSDWSAEVRGAGGRVPLLKTEGSVVKIKIITLRYDEGLQGFAAEIIEKALAGRSVLEVRDHFFVHAGQPHLCLVCTTDDGDAKGSPKSRRDDPGDELAPHHQVLYRDLRTWRNERAKKEGIPSYLILRNRQLAEICENRPGSLACLREIEGIGEATCKKYGQDILGMLADAPVPSEETLPK